MTPDNQTLWETYWKERSHTNRNAIMAAYLPRYLECCAMRREGFGRYRMTRDECISQAFEAFCRAIEQFDGKHDFDNMLASYVAKALRRPACAERVYHEKEARDEEGLFEQEQDHDFDTPLMLDEILGECDAEDRRIVRMRLDGYEYAEIGKCLAISQGTIWRRLVDLDRRLYGAATRRIKKKGEWKKYIPALIRDYGKGVSIGKLVRRYGINNKLISAALRENGVTVRAWPKNLRRRNRSEV